MATPVPSAPRAPATPAVATAPAAGFGIHPLRPFRDAFTFVRGTVLGGLDGMASLGRKGFFLGAVLGIVGGISASAVIPGLMIGAIGGFLFGAITGTVLGGLINGVQEVRLNRRRDLLGDEVVERELAARKAASMPQSRGRSSANGVNARVAGNVRENVADYNFQRAQQQEMENDRDAARRDGSFWRDSVDASRNHTHNRSF